MRVGHNGLKILVAIVVLLLFETVFHAIARADGAQIIPPSEMKMKCETIGDREICRAMNHGWEIVRVCFADESLGTDYCPIYRIRPSQDSDSISGDQCP